MRYSASSNRELVEHLEQEGYIETERVEQAFLSVDRRDFVPEEARGRAYHDRPLPIGEDATISAPHMVALNTELLEVEDDNRVVEVGSGSGYQLTILSELAEEVHGVEIQPELVKESRERLEDRENVTVHQGSGLGPVDGDFDRILYSCAIESPERARELLRDDGVIVAPVQGERGQVLKRFSNGEVEEHGRVRFVSFRHDGPV
ncbi:MAG: protein-L-isoaspartate O-methyltransferase [Candidatus Nanohaloarchaea archaeon]